MQRDEQHAVVLPEDLLRAVAVMHVVVDDRHAADAMLGLHVTGSDGDVVDETEAHRRPGPGVMPRRPHQGEGAGLGGLDRNAGGE